MDINQKDVMKTNIMMTPGSVQYMEDCTTALKESELGCVYFPDEGKARQTILEGITKKELLVALDADGACLGFLWMIPNGAFHGFPYLHIIAVKPEYRGSGVGNAMMRYFEEVLCKDASKAFLVVADFNPRAKGLYERIGYREVGCIPELYKPGVTEYVMMKVLG